MQPNLTETGDIRRFRRPPPTHELACERILGTLHTATPKQWAEGVEWYPYARRMACEIGDGRPEIGAAVLAALSPGCSWERSCTLAWDLLETGDCAHPYGECIDKARLALQGADFDGLYRLGLKVRSFYRNILFPLDGRFVTVDRHAFAIVNARPCNDAERAMLSRPNGYLHVAESYRRAAHIAGLPTPALQAITWVVWRDIYQYDRLDQEVF